MRKISLAHHRITACQITCQYITPSRSFVDRVLRKSEIPNTFEWRILDLWRNLPGVSLLGQASNKQRTLWIESVVSLEIAILDYGDIQTYTGSGLRMVSVTWLHVTL